MHIADDKRHNRAGTENVPFVSWRDRPDIFLVKFRKTHSGKPSSGFTRCVVGTRGFVDERAEITGGGKNFYAESFFQQRIVL
jgi:hypothetical protein